MFVNAWATFDEDEKVLRIKDGVVEISETIWNGISARHSWQNPDLQIQVIIPNSVEVIYSGAFCNVVSITKISIPNSVTTLSIVDNKGIFEQCSNLEEIELSEKLVEIPKDAFYCCENLKNIIIPNGIKRIGKWAFCWCMSLEEIIIPNTVEFLEEGIFQKCIQLKRVKLSDRLVEIPEMAFKFCMSLKNIIIPNGIKKINNFAFSNCDSLEKIIIPNSVEELGEGIFFQCLRLKEIKAPRHLVEKYGEKYIKSGTNAIITVYDGTIVEQETIETKNITTNTQKTSTIKSFNGIVRRNLIADKRKAIKDRNGNQKK